MSVGSKHFRSLVGSLIYLTNSRPDMLFSVSIISRLMKNPSRLYFAAVKRIMRYLQGTKDHGILYKKQDGNRLIGYSNSDWARSLDDRKNTSGYVFCLGTNIIFWCSRKHNSIAANEVVYYRGSLIYRKMLVILPLYNVIICQQLK